MHDLFSRPKALFGLAVVKWHVPYWVAFALKTP